MPHLNAISFLSAKPGAGKSYLSLHLAYLMAKRKAHVLLLDIDFHSAGLSDFFSLQETHRNHDWNVAASFLDALFDKNTRHEEWDIILKAAGHLAYHYPILDKEVYDYFSFIPCRIEKIPSFRGGIGLAINFVKFLTSAQKMGYEYVLLDCTPGNHPVSLIAAILSNTLLFVMENDSISKQATSRIKKQILQNAMYTLESLEILEKKQNHPLRTLIKDWQRFIKMEKQQEIFLFNRCEAYPKSKKKQNQLYILQEIEVAKSYNKRILAFPSHLIQDKKLSLEEDISPYNLSLLHLYKKIVQRYGEDIEDLDVLEQIQESLSEEDKEEISYSEESQILLTPESQELINEYQNLKEKYEDTLSRNHSLEQECLQYQEELERLLSSQREIAHDCEIAQKEYQKLYETYKEISEKYKKLRQKEDSLCLSSSNHLPDPNSTEDIEIKKLQKEKQKLQEEYIAQNMLYRELEQSYNQLVVELNAWKDKLYEIRQNHGTEKLVKDVLNELEKISFSSLE